MIETAAVIHSEQESGIYHLLADFLRFLGVSVYNYAVNERTKFNRTYEFDAVFLASFLSLTPEQEQQKTEWLNNKKCINVNNKINWDTQSENEKDERIRFLQNNVIDELKNNQLLQDTDYKVLIELAVFYVNYEILKNRVILQTFLGSKRFLRAVRRSLADCYIALLRDKTVKELYQNHYCWFALRYLERLLNEACGFLEEDMLFDTEKLVKRIEERIGENEGHKQYQAKLHFTIAHLYECDFFSQRKCVKPYEEGDNCAQKSPFEFYSAYRLGRCLEKYGGGWDRAISHYQRSLKFAPEEYRAAYKLAIYQWKRKKDTEKAAEYLLDVDKILQSRYENNVMQPREMEYLYKAWYFIGKIIEERGGQAVAAWTARDVENKKQDIIRKIQVDGRQNSCCKQIFGVKMQIDAADSKGNKSSEDVILALAGRVQAVCTL